MTRPGLLLENHCVAVTNGRISDILPNAQAKSRYAGTPLVRRMNHLLMPGLINAHTRAAARADCRNDALMLSIAEMLRAGITCFSDDCAFPDETARAAVDQGMRVCIGLPVAEVATAWAGSPAEYIGKALSVRDEYKGHPAVTTAFTADASGSLGDETLIRVRTLADELDSSLKIQLHASHAELRSSVERYGMRPLERLDALGMLTPSLTAVHMAHVTPSEIELARRGGINVTLCPRIGLRRGDGAPSCVSWAQSGVTLSLGTGAPAACHDQDLWSEARTAAMAGISPWDAFAMATRGGAAALGLSDHLGTLETGKWADICCIDLDHPALAPLREPVGQVMFCGGRDQVSDVWIAGRHLLAERTLTRLDWPSLYARIRAGTDAMKC